VAERPASRRARLLVLGAGPSQLGLLEAAHARPDLHVIALDADPQAPGFAFADERAIVSSEDEPAVDRLARAREVAGIASPGADWPVGIAARVAERMGLPHPVDSRTASIATSKTRQRERFAGARVPHARAFDPGDPRLPFPCVVKAPDRSGQRGLALVRSQAALAEAIAAASAASRNDEVLVEEHIEGPELTVNAISLDGVFHALAVTDRLTAEPPAFGVALAHVWPSLHDERPIAEVARAAVEAVGIRNGPSYTQLRLGSAGPVVMEVAARLGGGHDAELVEAVTGVDLNSLAIACALGEHVAVDGWQGGQTQGHVLLSQGGQTRGHGSSGPVPGSDPPGSRPVGGAAIVFLVPPVGKLRVIDGLDGARGIPGVVWARSYRRPGHSFGELRRGRDRAGAVLAVGASRGQALDRAHSAAQAVRFAIDANAS